LQLKEYNLDFITQKMENKADNPVFKRIIGFDLGKIFTKSY